MSDGKMPVKLTVDIDPVALKKIVEKGQLLNFAETFSTLAAEQLKAQLVDEIAKAAVGATQTAGGLHLGMGFDDDDFGVYPHKHWPWVSVVTSVGERETIREVVQEELAARTVNQM